MAYEVVPTASTPHRLSFPLSTPHPSSLSPPSPPSPSSPSVVSHSWRKVLHVSLNVSSLALVGFGLFCVFTSQPPPYVFTAHSWIGLGSAVLLGFQALLGLVYLLPSGHGDIKEAVLPLHAWLGVTAYTVAMLTVCTGIMNLMALYLTRGLHHYTEPPTGHEPHPSVMDPTSNEALIAALLGVVVLSILVFALYALMPRRRVEWEEGETGVSGEPIRSWVGKGQGAESQSFEA